MILAKKTIKTPVRKTDPFWGDTWRLLNQGAITPLISSFMTTSMFGIGPAELARSWAEDKTGETDGQLSDDPLALPSPLLDEDNRRLHRVAQYYSVQADARGAKNYYLDTLKGYLLAKADEDGIDADLGEKLEKKVERMDFSELAFHLGYPRFERIEDNPVRLLAELPLPLFITTSHHNFLEMALEQAHKEPESEIFYWDDALNEISSIYEREPGYKPTVDRPLVYHLYGLDKYPESLVLTEDDYLDFLIKVSSPEVRHSTQQRVLPSQVLRALASTSLLLLGYDVYEWEFRILFRGIIRTMNDSRANNNNVPEGISMQIEPGQNYREPSQVKDYLARYFKRARFKVYWGDVTSCARELWQIWRG